MEIKEIKWTGNVHSFRKQFYVTSKKKKEGGVLHTSGWGGEVLSIITISNSQHSIFHLLNFSNFLDTISLQSRAAPPQHSTSCGPLVGCGNAEPKDPGGLLVGVSSAGRGGRKPTAGGVMSPPFSFSQLVDEVGGVWSVDVSCPPSCSCCMPTCWSETSAEWRRSGCAARPRPVGTAENMRKCLNAESAF